MNSHEREPRSIGHRFRDRFADDRGAAVIEAAIYTPLLFVLLFAVIEFSLYFRSQLTAANGTREGSRMAAVMGDRGESDYEILQSIQNATSAVPRSDVQTIVVWRASGPDDSVPATCAAGISVSSGSRPCNAYTPSDFSRDKSEFGCRSGGPDAAWCPTSRKTAKTDPPDFVGIFVRFKYHYVTGFFGDEETINEQTIVRIEPQSLNDEDAP